MLDGVDWDGECEDVRKDGSRLWLDARVRLLRQPDGTTVGVLGIAEDITARKDAEAAARITLDTSRQTEERRRGARDAVSAANARRRTEDALLWHNRILELIARGTPLEETLADVVQMVEAQLPGSLCSVLLLDQTGCLRVGAAPSLPSAYNAAIEGQPIGPAQGSCGSAAFFGRTVVTADIATDDGVARVPRPGPGARPPLVRVRADLRQRQRARHRERARARHVRRVPARGRPARSARLRDRGGCAVGRFRSRRRRRSVDACARRCRRRAPGAGGNRTGTRAAGRPRQRRALPERARRLAGARLPEGSRRPLPVREPARRGVARPAVRPAGSAAPHGNS